MERASSLERCAGSSLQPWHELGASHCSTLGAFGGKAASEEALDAAGVSLEGPRPWRLRDARDAHPRGAAGAGGGSSLARSLAELPPPPTWLNHPKNPRRANGTWAVSGVSLALLSPWGAPALPSAASLGLDGAGTIKPRMKLLRSECGGFGVAAVWVLPPSWSRA